MNEWLWFHVVKIFDALCTLQTPADRVPAVVRNLRLELVEDFIEGAALGKLHDEEHVGGLGGGAEKFDDVRVIDSGKLPQLDEEGLVFIFSLEYFDGHVSVAPPAVQHNAEAALTEDLALLDLVVVDLFDKFGRGWRKNGPTRGQGCRLLALAHRELVCLQVDGKLVT